MSRMLARYEELIADGQLQADTAQRAAAQRLQQLQDELEAPLPKKTLFERFTGARSARPDPRGVYMWGGVGRGKSMIMDLFVETLAIERKRRVHFHAFMLEVAALVAEARKNQVKDPLTAVATQLSREIRCLAFDEMVVNNTADAAIMGRFFTTMMASGTIIVTTSNRPPHDLYKDGLNRTQALAHLKENEDFELPVVKTFLNFTADSQRGLT